MPRELVQEDALQGMTQLTKETQITNDPELTKSPEEVEDTTLGGMDAEAEDAMFRALAERNDKRDELHPYTQTLNSSDVESCVRLEAEAFPPSERCTREKVSCCSIIRQP